METSRQGAAAVGRGKLPKDRIHRSVGRARPIRYEITDRAPSDKATWDRVVALFCLGKAWQFKAYPKALFPVSIAEISWPAYAQGGTFSAASEKCHALAVQV